MMVQMTEPLKYVRKMVLTYIGQKVKISYSLGGTLKLFLERDIRECAISSIDILLIVRKTNREFVSFI